MSMFYSILKFNILSITLISSSLLASDQISLRQHIQDNDYKRTEQSLNKIPNVNEQNNLGETYLHTGVQTAIKTGDVAIIALLLNNPKTNSSLPNQLGKTPYMCAELHQQGDAMKLFELHQKKQTEQQREMVNPVASFSTDGNKQPLLGLQVKGSWICTSWFCTKHQ